MQKTDEKLFLNQARVLKKHRNNNRNHSEEILKYQEIS